MDKAEMGSIVLVLFFALCQIIGTMCSMPDLPLTTAGEQLAEDMSDMTCPMDGMSMCPPSLTASPERQIKSSAVAADVDFAPILLSGATTPVGSSDPVMSSVSSADSIVPISIASPSVLRI